ncbi:ras-related protein Rab-18A [Hydra vulgaris]|uniref:ras-related protein Rab-18A n=1 Tax=Hydra vulgaris TaxID=6087 RepID=UPI00019264CE|nr:ras-related protein Rab-18A [Hydra vulgaris]
MKVVLIGNINVGKSSFFVRFKEDKFVEKLNSTIGLDQYTKSITLSDGRTVKISLWDTAGLEVAGYMTSSYYRLSNGVVLMYDVKERETFNSLNLWIEDSKNYILENTPYFLLGNKIDGVDTEVNKVDAVNFAKSHNIPEEHVFEISVKTNKGIKKFIDSMATLLSCVENPVQLDTNKINLGQDKSKSGCC